MGGWGVSGKSYVIRVGFRYSYVIRAYGFKASPRIPAESFEEKVKISNLGYPVGGSKYDPDI